MGNFKQYEYVKQLQSLIGRNVYFIKKRKLIADCVTGIEIVEEGIFLYGKFHSFLLENEGEDFFFDEEKAKNQLLEITDDYINNYMEGIYTF